MDVQTFETFLYLIGLTQSLWDKSRDDAYSLLKKLILFYKSVTEIQNEAFYYSGLEVIEFEVNSTLETIGGAGI